MKKFVYVDIFLQETVFLIQKKCWYKHDKLENDSNEKVTVENQELWDKLLSMMEQMTERITLMENQNKEK